jgi:hypothetical protein
MIAADRHNREPAMDQATAFLTTRHSRSRCWSRQARRRHALTRAANQVMAREEDVVAAVKLERALPFLPRSAHGAFRLEAVPSQ